MFRTSSRLSSRRIFLFERRNMTKMTVLMPVYNTPEEYLRAAIDSILNQTFTDFEFIIVDDGSTNNAVDVVKSYHDKRIRFVQNEKNMGLSAVRNKLMSLATNEYVAWADSDDIYLPTRLEKQNAYLDNHPDVSCVGGSYELFPQHHVRQLPEKVLLLDMLRGNIISQSIVMYRRQDFKHLSYDTSLTVAEDYDFWVRALLKGLKLANFPEVLFKYCWHENNISHKKDIMKKDTQKVKDMIIQNLTSDINIQKRLPCLFEETVGVKIPFYKVKFKNNVTRYYLFGFIPILKRKTKG